MRRDTGPWQAPRNDAGWKKQRRRIIAALDAQVDREYALAEKTFIDYQNQLSEADHDNFSDFLTEYWKPEPQKKRALAAFRQGDSEPLREYVRRIDPDLVKFVREPEMDAKGHHFEKAKPEPFGETMFVRLSLQLRVADGDKKEIKQIDPHLRVNAAIADVRRIRDYRQRHLDRKRNGPIGGGLTAEGIAADRWGLTEAEVRHKRPSRATLAALKKPPPET